jgi:hypothetical protein
MMAAVTTGGFLASLSARRAGRIGSLRRRTPVAAKIAFPSAGAAENRADFAETAWTSPLGITNTSKGGNLVDANLAVVMEIALLDAALVEGDARCGALPTGRTASHPQSALRRN